MMLFKVSLFFLSVALALKLFSNEALDFLNFLVDGSPEAIEQESIYGFSVNDIDGKKQSLSKYKGHVCLIVNVACKCGLTANNYPQLQELYAKYYAKGLRILAFPSNQFGWQEPWPENEIKEFVKQYNVQFDMFSKISVNGKDTHPLYKFLKSKSPGTLGDFLKWNFTKFLINKNGEPVKRYAPNVEPSDIEQDIVQLLSE